MFDPAQAKDIEAQALRGYAFDIMHRYTAPVAVEGEGQGVPPRLFLTGIVRPSDYIKLVDALDEWADDYERTYREDPFEGLEGEAFLSAGRQIMVPKGPSTAQLVEQLRQLRDES